MDLCSFLVTLNEIGHLRSVKDVMLQLFAEDEVECYDRNSHGNFGIE